MKKLNPLLLFIVIAFLLLIAWDNYMIESSDYRAKKSYGSAISKGLEVYLAGNGGLLPEGDYWRDQVKPFVAKPYDAAIVILLLNSFVAGKNINELNVGDVILFQELTDKAVGSLDFLRRVSKEGGPSYLLFIVKDEKGLDYVVISPDKAIKKYVSQIPQVGSE